MDCFQKYLPPGQCPIPRPVSNQIRPQLKRERRSRSQSNISSESPSMQPIHLADARTRATGPRFGLASIFGANMGDFFSPTILGSATSTDSRFLAMAFAIVIMGERFDRACFIRPTIGQRSSSSVRQRPILRISLCGDMKLPRVSVIAALTGVTRRGRRPELAMAVASEVRPGRKPLTNALRADSGYWISMLIAGTLGHG